MLIFPQSRSYSTGERFVIKLSVYALSPSLLLRKIQLPLGGSLRATTRVDSTKKNEKIKRAIRESPLQKFCDACSFAKIILLSYKNENDKGKTALVIMLISIKVLSLFYLHNAITSSPISR